MDLGFIHDRTEDGRTITNFSLIDEYSRYCLTLKVENKINAKAVRQALQQACAASGHPRHIRSDNGPEFIADTIREWITEQRIQTLHIEPGCPWQNPFLESFHSRFRNDCLNRERKGRRLADRSRRCFRTSCSTTWTRNWSGGGTA